MNLNGKELHAFVYSDATVINPLERVKTVAFANKNDLEAALLHVRGMSNITVLKSQVHIVVPGMARDTNTFASLVTNPKNNTKRIFIQLFKDAEALNGALDVLASEFDTLNVASFSKETRVMNYTEFRRAFRETTRVI
ncbi:hypothetical protein [Acinetobacter indicus]|uniref:Uncharacterized protein n=1 Tax=Acinetobacter indicus TaxID=756892 RepID=A0A6C0Y6R7_9GAMM|nr:hypothetical protein [Acinetobacter indicus]QIC71793.1 hypothetical protein FSC09_15485 [Acinetobacter indicus]